MMQLPNRLHRYIAETFPEDWDRIVAHELFKESSEKVSQIKGQTEAIPVLSMTMENGLVLQRDKFDKRVASKDHSSYKVVRAGDLVYGFPIDEGVIAFLESVDIGAVSPVYAVWNSTREADRGFLQYLLKSPAMIHVYKMLNSSTVERRRILSKYDFQAIPIPIPTLDEQRSIARVLDTLRQNILTTERFMVACNLTKRSLMEYLFTYGPVPFPEIRTVEIKKTKFGASPIDWKFKKLSEIVSVQGGLWSGNNPPLIQTKVLRNTNFKNDGTLDTSDIEEIQVEERKLKFRVLQLGDIILERSGGSTEQPVGRVVFFDTEDEIMSFSNFTTRLRVKTDEITPKFLFYYLHYFYKSGHTQSLQSRTTGIRNLSFSDYLSIPIPIPPLSEHQNIIVESIDKISNLFTCTENEHRSLTNLFQSVLHQLITGKTRVHIK